MSLSYFDAKLLQNAIAMEPKKEESENEGEWIWVTGYKGTDRYMKCRNYQFELNEKYDMPDGEAIVTCRSGFHFCKHLKDVFKYYDIGNGNRFFEVSALVRKGDWESSDNKFTSRSIIFTSECAIDEIFRNTDIEEGWTIEDKKYALEHGLKDARKRLEIEKLVELGYSRLFAHLIVENDKGRIALAVGAQSDLSMDMKVYTIFTARDPVSDRNRRLKDLASSLNISTAIPSFNPYYGRMGK